MIRLRELGELASVARVLRRAGWRGMGGGTISADVRALTEAWYDAERRAAQAEHLLADAS